MKSKSDLIQYLSSKTGIPVYNEIKITLNENYARNNRVQIWIRIGKWEYQIHKAVIKGGVEVLRINRCMPDAPFAFKDIPMDTKIDKTF